MVDFSHLDKLKVTPDRTAEYTLYQIEAGADGHPVLILAPATDANKPFQNAALKKSTTKNFRRMRGGSLTPEMLEEDREDDRKLYPRHVVKGWRNVTDAKGKDVSFTSDNVLAFLRALPNWVFDDVRMFAGNPSNFLQDDDAIDTEGLAKN